MNLKEIDIQGAKELLDKEAATFADIRDPASFEAAHIPGATNLSDATVASFVEQTDKERPLIVYCYHGNNSQGGALFFQEQGFEDVYSMSGGFEAWRGVHEHESGAGPT